MERYLATPIEPIEVAFVRSGLDTALDVAAVKAVERGVLALEGGGLRVADPSLAGDALTRTYLAALTATPVAWKTARANAKLRAGDARRDLERRLVASGLLREPSPWRWAVGRRTPCGKAWLRAAQLAFPRRRSQRRTRRSRSRCTVRARSTERATIRRRWRRTRARE